MSASVTVGLTGGIGAGKSTVAAGLARRGAAVIDADQIARAVLEPDGAAYDQVLARFGPELAGPERRVDRAALAHVVFADPAARADLEAIVHPLVRAQVAREVAAVAGRKPAVIDIPLLDRNGREQYGLDGVIVVDAPLEVAVARVVSQRHLTEADVWARVRTQLPREERLAFADFVIDNAGPPADLEPQIDRAWSWIASLSRASGCHTGPVR